MARPKPDFLPALAKQAKADLKKPDPGNVTAKPGAIASAAKYPPGAVAEITGVAKTTIWRWVVAYRGRGPGGLVPKGRRARPSRLGPEQKAAVLSWLAECMTAKGEPCHWTLERLGLAIAGEFGVRLGKSAVRKWLRKEGRVQKAPRPRHCAADEGAQRDFKKNSRRR